MRTKGKKLSAQQRRELEEETHHREAMVRAAKHGIASFYRNPEAALALLDEYLEKHGATGHDTIMVQFDHEVRAYAARVKKEMPLRQQPLSVLEHSLFPSNEAVQVAGKIPGAYFMDRRYHGDGRGW